MEYKVYVLNADEVKISGYDIEDWLFYEEKHRAPHPESYKFVELAEQQGTVYSLFGFQNALNLEEIILVNDWVYITNLH